MAVQSVVAFWGVALALIVVPGPDWAFTVSAGTRGRGISAAFGIALGYVAMTIAVAAGLGAAIAAAPLALGLLTVVGSIYLCWLGSQILRAPARPREASIGGPKDRLGTVLRGVVVSGMNPKGLLILVALLPQFTSPAAAWPVPIQIAVLGLVFAATCAAVYLGVGACSERLLSARPTMSVLLSRISGISMIIVGLLLLVEQVKG